MYIVPMEIPQYCNKCPFGHCNYSFPFGDGCTDPIDGKRDETETYGYVCNIDHYKNGMYTKVMRSDIGWDIDKPGWCPLKEGGGS